MVSPFFLHSLLTSKGRLIEQLTRLFPTSQLRRGRSYNPSVSDQLAPPPRPASPSGGFVTLHRPAPEPSQMYNRPPWAAPARPNQCPPCPPCAQCHYGGVEDDHGVSDGYGPPQDQYGLPQDSYSPPQDTYGFPQDNYSPPQESYGPSLDTNYNSYGRPENIYYNSFGRPHDNPEGNVFKPQPVSDGYGAPLAPPVTAKPCHHPHNGYSVPSEPCSKPIYLPQPYPAPPPYTTSNPVYTSYQPPFFTTTTPTTTSAPACLEVFTSTEFSLNSARGLRPPSSCTYLIVPGEVHNCTR